jgi:hypothetical protein
MVKIPIILEPQGSRSVASSTDGRFILCDDLVFLMLDECLLYQPQMIDDECGVVGGMRIGRGNRSTRRKLTPVPLCPPQIPHDLTWARTRAAAVGSPQLTA